MDSMVGKTESATRRDHIDPKLAATGWVVTPYVQNIPIESYTHHAIEEYPTSNGPVDYALVVDGLIIALVEAKKIGVSPNSVLIQAQRYARGVEDSPYDYQGFRVPFIYSTNGKLFYFQDLRLEKSRSREVSGFHTPEALMEYLGRDFNASYSWFQENPNTNPRSRPYQVDANDSIEDALTKNKRHMMVAMATGTGKTFMIVSQIYRLMKSGLAKRILFLVDRRALAAQAVSAFSTFEAEPGLKFDKIYEVYSQRFQREDFDEEDKFNPKVLPNEYLTNPKSGHAFVYVSTIQRMRINLFGFKDTFRPDDLDKDDDSDTIKLDIPIHAFDVIIADECHRGYTASEVSKWREVLKHFDAVQIGLTATPAAHTTAYFRNIVYRYEYERAVREGYLVDWDAITIESNVRINGVFLKEGEIVGQIDTETGVESFDSLEDERSFDSSDIERSITSPDSNKKIIREIKKYALAHEETYGQFPKILIFAANDLPHTSHCDALVDLCRDEFGQGDAFVQKITGSPNVDRPLQRIREFRNRPNPKIVVTRDMLTTGVDIPALEYLVFFRPVKSRILWEQMLGRGTRRCDEIHKTHFTVFDCFNGDLLKYFKNVTAFDTDPPVKAYCTNADIIEDIYENRDRDYNVKRLVKRLQRIDKELPGSERKRFAHFIPEGDLRAFASDITKRIVMDFNELMKTLRNPEFQRLLKTYKRPKRGFIVSYETQDEVKSEWIIREPGGGQWKPEDYLVAFSRFVKENPEHIEAIEILLNRPVDWKTEALTELRRKLTASGEHFSEENLQKAHKLRYHKELADIISMIKHAVNEGAPLLTAEERVDRAFSLVIEGKSFTDIQLRWLERIRDHLITNLTIDRNDFDLLPVFQREGGWTVANRIFNNDLESLLQEFNAAVAT